MVSEELAMVERIGVGAAIALMMFYLLRETQRRTFAQADKVLQLAETTIKDNTVALGKMFDGLEQHMKQKDSIKEEMRECRRDRDIKLDQLSK